MKKVYIIISALVCVFSFLGCQQELHNQDHSESFTAPEDSDTAQIYISVSDQTTSQQKTEYLWTNSARYIIKSDNGYELYDGYTDNLIGIYSDFRILNRFNRQGEIEKVCYIVGEDNGKTCLLEVSNNTLIFQKEIKESIAFYGDYIVIDGRLYNSDNTKFTCTVCLILTASHLS